MPRPKRDYAAQLRLDIDKCDAQIRTLVVRRSKLLQMLRDYETMKESDIDVTAALREIVQRKSEPPRRGRR